MAGTYSLKEVTTGEGSGALEKTGFNTSEIWVQFKVKVPNPFDDFGTGGYFRTLVLEDTSDVDRFWTTIEEYSPSVARLVFDGDQLSYTNTLLNLVEGATNTIEVRVKTGSSNGDVDIWLNNTTQGSPDYNGSGTPNVGTATLDDFLGGLVYAPNSGISDIFYDNFIVNNSFIGSGANTAPTAPTLLQVESQTDPTNISDSTPEFSAIYNDDTGDSAISYKIQVSTSTSFTSPFWSLSTTTMATTTAGNRNSPEISYSGTALASSTTYYWRIAFSDDDGATGAWSTGTSTFSLAASAGGGGGTTTFFAHSGDGYVRNGWLADTWANVRGASSGSLWNSSSTEFSVHSGFDSGTTQYVNMRGFIPFDTSSLPDDAVVTSATLHLYASSFPGGNGTTTGIVLGTPASTTNLALGNYDQIGSTEGTDRVSVTTTGWKTYTLNSTGKGWISPTGWTNLAVRTVADLANYAPAHAGGFYIGAFFGTAESSNDPYLEITYTTGEEEDEPSVLQDITFTYNANGNITQLTDRSDTGAGKAVTYLYDPLNRITSASTTAASSTSFAQTYAYKKIGNITNKSDVGAYTYAETNYANPHAPTSVNGVTYTYDNNGNLSYDGTYTYTWDYQNRLTAVGTGSGTTTYAYDHMGNRVKKVEGGVTTLYPIDSITSQRRVRRPPPNIFLQVIAL